jgi:hypothetical protein
MGSVPKTIRYEVQKEPLFDTNLSNGLHTQTLSGGLKVEAHVEGGSVVGYTAYDSTGKPLPVRRLRLTDAPVALAGVECMYCICDEFTCRCWTEPCL